ncbi:glycoside hydrolase family 2 protein [Bacteroidota bacterium]
MKLQANILFICFILITLSVHGQKRAQIDLNENWKVTSVVSDDELSIKQILQDDESLHWYKGDMPKQAQEFILENGELPDPAVRDNAKKWVDVFEKDWIYYKEFETPAYKGDIVLCFDGIDTEADIYLNGEKLAYCNNMHRRWRIPITGKLKASGEKNSLSLRFYPPQKVMDKFSALYPDSDVVPIKYIRKTVHDFKSYLGADPPFLKVGIFDNVYLDLLPEAYFGDVQIQTFLNNDFSSAEIQIDSEINNFKNLKVEYQVFHPGDELVTKGKVSAGNFKISIDKPELWYPMNYGEQPMYKIRMRLLDKRKLMDEAEVEFGIRDVKIIQEDEQTGNPLFCIQVNGKKIFMNGACWAPLQGFTHVWNKERADSLLRLMKLGNMNFLRVWGPGSIPGKSLFDFCDKNGIVLMMEFMTSAPLAQPIFDPGFMENITLEIEDEIKRLRNHPCIAFWSGGNEHYLLHKSNLGDNTLPVGRALFQKIMPGAVEKFDPQRYFHPSSPWGGDEWINGNYPLAGDYHDYSTFRFEPLSSVPLFTTEACMVSPYSADNMRKFMSEEELWPDGFEFIIDSPGKNAWPPGWEKHSLGTAWEKTGRIQDYCDIQNVEDACRVFGTAHGQYLKERYERQRRGVPDGEMDEYRRSWGAAVWRLNDTWPMIYMSVVDYYLEPKIPYYFLKRASEPLLISFEQTDEKICVWLINDTPERLADSLIVELISFDGKVKKRCSYWADLKSSESKRVIDLSHEFYEILKRNEFLLARYADQVKTHLLFPEKFLKLENGTITATYDNGELMLESDTYIKAVELSIPDVSGAVFNDNYFDLFPGQIKQVSIIEQKDGKQIRIQGLNSEVEVLQLN